MKTVLITGASSGIGKETAKRFVQNGTYLRSDKLAQTGIPSIEFFANKLHLSPGYLTDVLKHETGKTTKEHLQLFLIEQAKYRLLNTSMTVNEVAYSLGFTYPQYFNRLFKARTGMTPMAFRQVN